MFYFFPNLGSDDKVNGLNKPFRILELQENSPFAPTNIRGYRTTKELRKKDQEWKKYYKQDPQSAQKICDKRFILTAHNWIVTPSDPEFNEVSYKLLKHTVMGNYQKT